MHSIKIQEVINQMTSFLYRAGFWHRGNAAVRELSVQWFYCIHLTLFLVSLIMGEIKDENKEESAFSVELMIIIFVLLVKLCFLIWKQNDIMELLHRIATFSIRNDEDFAVVNKELGRFTTFAIAFFCSVLVAGCLGNGVLPFLRRERTLFYKIAFPVDWKNNETAFWIATIFNFSALFVVLIALFYAVIIWYLMLNCTLRYEVLGNELKRMGQVSEEGKLKTSLKDKSNGFLHDLKASIDTHLHLRELVDQLETFVSNIFFLQIFTSGLCICGSIYSLAFDVNRNVIMQSAIHLYTVFYHTGEIFMITYYGNEIMRTSDRLRYSLFESDWVDQPQSTKKCIIIFGEYLKQPQALVIANLYPLTLETFTTILNSAYRMFNVLKSFSQ